MFKTFSNHGENLKLKTETLQSLTGTVTVTKKDPRDTKIGETNQTLLLKPNSL